MLSLIMKVRKPGKGLLSMSKYAPATWTHWRNDGNGGGAKPPGGFSPPKILPMAMTESARMSCAVQPGTFHGVTSGSSALFVPLYGVVMSYSVSGGW